MIIRLIAVAHNLRRFGAGLLALGIIPFSTILGRPGMWVYFAIWAASLACFIVGSAMLGVYEFMEWRADNRARQAESAARWQSVMGA